MPTIHIKNSPNTFASHTPNTLIDYLNKQNKKAIAGIEIYDRQAWHFLYHLTQDNKLHRYPLRNNNGNYNPLPMYNEFNPAENTFLTTPIYSIFKIDENPVEILTTSQIDSCIANQPLSEVANPEMQRKFLAIINAVCYLDQQNMLTQENFDRVALHNKLVDLAEILQCLQQTGLLTQANFAFVADHNDLRRLAYTLTSLHENRLLTQENFTLVIAHNCDLYNLVSTLNILSEASLLNPESRAVVAANSNLFDLKCILDRLQETHLLNQENVALFAPSREQPYAFVDALVCLQQTGLLNQENRALVAAHPDQNLAVALMILHDAGVLNQCTFTSILSRSEPRENIDEFISAYCKTINAYQKIYSAASTTHVNEKLQQAYALLLDYTKGKIGLINSPLSFFESVAAKCKRGLTGHMNRHHIDAVAEILDRIRKNEITSATELIEPLRAIQQTPGFNQHGSLAKRIHFICEKYRTQESTEQMQKETYTQPNFTRL